MSAHPDGQVDGQAAMMTAGPSGGGVTAAARAGHDTPHYANGPVLGAPAPVSAVCVCRCSDCCGHRPGNELAVGVPGRCEDCSCYLATAREAEL